MNYFQPQQPQQVDIGQALWIAFLTGIASAAGAALFNEMTKSKRRHR